MDSTATLLDGQMPEATSGLVRGKLSRFELSSEDKDWKILCRGETPLAGTGLQLESGKFWCWVNGEIACKVGG